MCREEMMIGRSHDPEHPARIAGVPTPRTCLGLDCGTHLGQRQVPRKQAGYMTAHRTVVDPPPVTPCTPGPSTHDPAIHVLMQLEAAPFEDVDARLEPEPERIPF